MKVDLTHVNRLLGYPKNCVLYVPVLSWRNHIQSYVWYCVKLRQSYINNKLNVIICISTASFFLEHMRKYLFPASYLIDSLFSVLYFCRGHSLETVSNKSLVDVDPGRTCWKGIVSVGSCNRKKAQHFWHCCNIFLWWMYWVFYCKPLSLSPEDRDSSTA